MNTFEVSYVYVVIIDIHIDNQILGHCSYRNVQRNVVKESPQRNRGMPLPSQKGTSLAVLDM